MNTSRRLISRTIVLSIILTLLVGCQSGTSPVMPTMTDVSRLTNMSGPGGDDLDFDTENYDSLGPLHEESDLASHQNLPSTPSLDRIETQNSLSLVGSLHFEIESPFPIQPGEEVRIRFKMKDVDDIFGCGLDLGFDKANLNFQEVDFTGSTLGEDLVTIGGEFVEGEIGLGITRKRNTDGNLYGFTGSGLLATVIFVATGNINTPDELGLAILDHNSVPRYIKADVTEARFEIETSLDIETTTINEIERVF